MPLQFMDRLFEQLGVHLETDGGDLPGLVGAEQVAGAAQLQVVAGDAESGAELGQFLQYPQPFARLVGQASLAGDQQVGVGAPVGAADPAAQLIELGEAETVGAVDDDGVGARDVEAVLDDRACRPGRWSSPR